MNIHNWITISRLLGVFFLFYFLITPLFFSRWLSLIVFLTIASTDWLDGYLARKMNQVTDLGKFLDPLVDKIFIILTLLGLVIIKQISIWGIILIIIREVGITCYRINSIKNKKGPKEAKILGKAKTVSQIIAIAFLIAPLSQSWDEFTNILFWISVALTLISGLIYIILYIKVKTNKI